MIDEFSGCHSNKFSVFVTAVSVCNLNKRFYSTRGHHLFKNHIKIPNLASNDRKDLLKRLFNDSKHLKLDKNINWEKFINLTDGYHIGDMIQFVDRSIFFAIKQSEFL